MALLERGGDGGMEFLRGGASRVELLEASRMEFLRDGGGRVERLRKKGGVRVVLLGERAGW
jgi:hypothetical protein